MAASSSLQAPVARALASAPSSDSFLSEVRIGQARRLMVETDRAVARIAFASGYETPSKFNRSSYKLAGKIESDCCRPVVEHSTLFREDH